MLRTSLLESCSGLLVSASLSRRRPGQRCQVQTGPPALWAEAAQEEVFHEDDQKEGSRWKIMQEVKEEFKVGARCNSKEGRQFSPF